MPRILIINGPNLNLLGARERALYGERTMEELLEEWRQAFPQVELHHLQSNLEGELVEAVQQVLMEQEAMV